MQTEQIIGHGGDCLAKALKTQGVRFLFTLCGGHISPILTGAKALGIKIIDVRDEATAVFAADAVSRLTGVPGVAAVTAGPGLTNTLTALKNAQLAQSPIVVIGGAAPTALQGRGALQDIDQAPVVAPHVKKAIQIRRVRDLAWAIEEAFAVAREGVQGPVFLECPVDILYPEEIVRQWYADASPKGRSVGEQLISSYLKRHVDVIFAGNTDYSGSPSVAREVAPPMVPSSRIVAATSALARAARPLIVIGSQAMAIAQDAPHIADAVSRLGIPVYLSGMARGLLGRDHPLQMRHQRRQALRESDCVVLAGVPCDFRLDYGRHVGRASTLIAANRSNKDARLNRRPDVAAIGDAGLFLRRLAERLSEEDEDPVISTDSSNSTEPSKLNKSPNRRQWQGWIEQLRTRDQARESEIDQQSQQSQERKSHERFVNPIALLRAIDSIASDTVMFVADGGDFVGTASYILKPRRPLAWLDPGVFGTLGVGAGFALGAALCNPDAEVWIIYGDGACGYGLVEFDTFVRHGIPVIAVVGNDSAWTQIAREQVKLLHDDVGTVLARTAYHEVAAGFGAKGILVKNAADVPAALAQARSHAKEGHPVLINVWLDRSDFREGSLSM